MFSLCPGPFKAPQPERQWALSTEAPHTLLLSPPPIPASGLRPGEGRSRLCGVSVRHGILLSWFGGYVLVSSDFFSKVSWPKTRPRPLKRPTHSSLMMFNGLRNFTWFKHHQMGREQSPSRRAFPPPASGHWTLLTPHWAAPAAPQCSSSRGP